MFAGADWILATIPAFGWSAAVPALPPVLGGVMLVAGGIDFEYRHRGAFSMFASGWGLLAAWAALTGCDHLR